MVNSINGLIDNSSIDFSTVEESTYERIVVLFWLGAALYLILALLAIVGNALVLYTTLEDINMGPLRYLDDVIKSLALADMLYGLIGVPCKLTADYYVGKCHDSFRQLT
jgi:hypothetical protein